MITVGLIKEIFFISKVMRRPYRVDIFDSDKTSGVCIKISPFGSMDIFFLGYHVWNEDVDGELSSFGVESCDAISRIINCIINNDDSWRKYRFIQRGEDFSLTNTQKSPML